MNVKKNFFLVVFICTQVLLLAQPEVCQKNYSQKLNEGIALFNKGDYRSAARTFKSAQCPSLTATQQVTLDDWARKCAKGINAHKSKADGVRSDVLPKPTEKPSVEILYSGYLRATCNDGVRGAELAVLITAKNLKDNKVKISCFMAPQGGDGKVNVASPLASNYTIGDGLSGLEQEIVFAAGEECVATTLFVPFSVMNFAGKYSPQLMKTDVYIYLPKRKQPVAEHHQVYESLSPHTISLGGRVGDYNLEVDWLGGLLDLHPAVCSGNEVLWKDLPSWIVSDKEGMHVTENSTESPRSATIHVSSSEGGNTINVVIFQKGREEGHSATAQITKVWQEEKTNKGDKKFIVHVDYEVSGARGKEIRAYAVFYSSDGTTPLRTSNGKEIRYYSRAMADYTESAFDDIPINISLSSLLSAVNNNENRAIYYVCISEDKGKSWMTQSGPYTIIW